MVKGVSRRVIVVESPDRRYFEEAIFILRNDIPLSGGGQTAPILEEACRIARRCVQRRRPRPVRLRVPAPCWTLLGAAAMAVLWLTSSLI